MKYLLFLLLPKSLISRIVGRMARWERPGFLVRGVQKWFVRRYRLNMSEAEKELKDYSSLNALFTRKLKPGLRSIVGEVVHPCDGVISQSGSVENGQILQVKGWTYSVQEMIGEPLSSEILEGSFATYYLCPTDYHRVHFPIGGFLTSIRHRVGKLWPVNEWSVGAVKNLFCKNERVVFKIQTQFGPVFMVMVGATNVGHITSHYAPELQTNTKPRTPMNFDFSEAPMSVKAGDEAGVFEMGSTVVMVFPKGLSKKISLSSGPTEMGQNIAF